MPLGARLFGMLSGHHKELHGPYELGKWGFVLNAIGFAFLVFASITFNFPTGVFHFSDQKAHSLLINPNSESR